MLKSVKSIVAILLIVATVVALAIAAYVAGIVIGLTTAVYIIYCAINADDDEPKAKD